MPMITQRGYPDHVRRDEIQPWMLFAFPAAIVVPIVAGLLLGGPAIGFVVAAVVALVIIGVALRGDPALEEEMEPSWRRAAARRFAVAAAIAAAGIVVIVASSGTGRIIGWGVLGVGLVVAISLVFLEIGYSEDRERARDAGRR
jgi:hypothetical protein